MSDNGTAITRTATVYDALLAFQADAPELQKTGLNPHFDNKFVALEHLIAQVTPALTQHGLVWSTFPCEKDGEPALRYSLTHPESGTSIGETMLLRSKGTPQDQGSAITYARRYSMMAVLNLAANEDDDGRKASRTQAAATRTRTPKSTLDALKAAAHGLTGAKIKLAFASAGLPFPEKGGMFDHINSADGEMLIQALEAAPR